MAEKDLPEAHGWMVMMFDCPECGEIVEIDHDASGEVVKCDACGADVQISEVR